MTFLQSGNRAHSGQMADVVLIVASGTLAFLLGCYELFDPDIWWHVRAGQWILAHGRVPRLDIFSFASADRVWVDLHWGFQVVLAIAFALAGVAGMILLASTAGCAAFLIAMTARAPDWPRWLAVLCWLPALTLMAMRFDPRPEIFSLVYLACYLAVLVRLERRPKLAWLLPAVQVFWVNTHGLFVLGPVVLCCYLFECALRFWGGKRSAWEDRSGRERPRWRHLAALAAAVTIACFVNPYGLRGAMFPLELYPKISDPANLYKIYVDEFTSLHQVMFDRMHAARGAHPHVRTQMLLLLLLPVSFVLPAAWANWRASFEKGGQPAPANAVPWAGGLFLAFALAALAVLGIPLPGTPRWLVGASRMTPVLMFSCGGLAALRLGSRSPFASATIAVGTAAVAVWTAWLASYFFDDRATGYGLGNTALAYTGAALGALSIVLIVRAGGSVFRLLLTAAFTFLAFQAIRNINLFGLVAGAVLAWNVCEWSSRLAVGRRDRTAVWMAPLLITILVGLWAVAIVTDRYYQLTGDNTHFGLREKPLTFGHAAARFAGRPGLPVRALAFDLGQTGVYIYHNGPRNKVFMDARLEVPSAATFRTYVTIEEWLNQGDPRWDAAIARLGDPLILIAHEGWAGAEASMLAHPRWRCVYFDAVASVFVTRAGPSSAPDFPELDLMASHFAGWPADFGPVDARTATAEATALFRLAVSLRRRGGDTWRSRIPLLTRANDLTRAVLLRETFNPATWWWLLGVVQWELAPDLKQRPPGPSDIWDPATGLSWARATYCFRRALEARPEDEPTLRSLAESFGARGMSDDRREIERRLIRTSPDRPSFTLAGKRPTTRVAVPWSEADRLAVNHLHRGEPELASRTWAEAAAPTSMGLREARLAQADLVALDARAAAAHCRRALQLDPTLGEAWYVLTLAALDSRAAHDALAACRGGLMLELTAAQRQALAALEPILSRIVHPTLGRD